MAVKNFYIVLGVPQDATDARIRAAYRDLAKRHHPDVVGEGGTRHFQEIVEAYGVLSDPERRRAHNRDLDEERSRRAPSPSPRAMRVTPEPLIPEPMAQPPGWWPTFEPWSTPFGGFAHGARRHRVTFDLILSREEARRGGTIPIRVPSQRLCARCRGSGRDGMFLCLDCAGRGRILVEDALYVRIPPGVRSGTLIEASSVSLRLVVTSR